jgi:hypothetical protein
MAEGTRETNLFHQVPLEHNDDDDDDDDNTMQILITLTQILYQKGCHGPDTTRY